MIFILIFFSNWNSYRNCSVTRKIYNIAQTSSMIFDIEVNFITMQPQIVMKLFVLFLNILRVFDY